MTCRIVSYAASWPPGSGAGSAYVVTRCETHGVDNVVAPTGLCAFGEIELKLDRVLARLEDVVVELQKVMPCDLS